MKDKLREEYLKQALEITKEQYTYLLNEEHEKFEMLIEERQELIDKIRDTNESQKEPLTLDEKKILELIVELDAQTELELSKQMEEVKDDIKNLNKLSNRDKKYIDPYPALSTGRYFDEGRK